MRAKSDIDHIAAVQMRQLPGLATRERSQLRVLPLHLAVRKVTIQWRKWTDC